MKITACHVADQIDLKELSLSLSGRQLNSVKDELFIKTESGEYLQVLSYGVVCSTSDFYSITEQLQLVKKQASNWYGYQEENSDSFQLELFKERLQLHYNQLDLIDDDPQKIRMVMLHLSQSVALSTYASKAEDLLMETKKHTSLLERDGRLQIKGKKLKKYIGGVLNIKNDISEHLYIFDSPDEVWDDENLNDINNALKKAFDVQERYRIIKQQLDIVKENLDLFKEIMFHNESSRLEWIIIILIVIEVIDLFILKFL